MKDLEHGFTVNTKTGKTVKVIEKLGEGGQGAVYKVDYAGTPKALKWYSGKKFANPDKFYKNLENNIELAEKKGGPPAKAFLWPQDLTERTEKTGEAFGYVMDLFPDGYEDFPKFLNGRVGFGGVNAMVNSALNITAAFRALHSAGYSYQDLNDGNFRINPKNGDVLICDNDNVSEYGKDSGIAGKARYMAPEIVTGKAKPDPNTDRFSLSVTLFLLFTNSHPLEGARAVPPKIRCMDAKSERKIFGEEPLFIFDPADKSNAPVPGLHKGVITRWPSLPVYLREKFTTAFSQEVMLDPNKRIIETDWLNKFIRMKSEIFKCPCGTVYFADPAAPNPCPGCGKTNSFPLYLKTPGYNIPLSPTLRARLYACHTTEDSYDYTTITGECAPANGGFELKNLSGRNWTVTGPDGSSTISPNAAAALRKGQTINFGGGTAEVV